MNIRILDRILTPDEEKELAFEGHDLHEYLARDVERWIAENRAAHSNRISKEALYELLADKVDVSTRQLKRYLDGATDIGILKAVSICKEIGLHSAFEYANYNLGLDTCETPAIPATECDAYDAAEELIKNIKAFSEYTSILAESLNEKPSIGMLHKIRRSSLAARKQILQYERLYYQKLKEKAGQRGLF